MKKVILTLWLFLPVLLLAYHYGPGQDRLKRDDVSLMLKAADHYIAKADWEKAIGLYDQALFKLPEQEKTLSQQVRLEKAKAQMRFSQLPEARRDLQILMDELMDSPAPDSKIALETRRALAGSQYYMTWLMRLEGLPEETWKPEIESARQNYRLLAEKNPKEGGGASSKMHQEDLESAIRLARMDLGELQGLPLPSQ
jgi:tetratricopeptide (TPR) repeat protein